MKSARRTLLRSLAASLLVLAWTVLPALAAGESAPDPADTSAGIVFRWLNFALVMGGIVYLIRKLGAPYFRERAQSISSSIHSAAETRAAAQRELDQADGRLSAIALEIQDLRRAAVSESAAEAGRLRALAQNEADKIAQAARAEIVAAERAARLALRATAAQLATEGAASLVRARMNVATEGALFRSFVEEIAGSTP